MAEIYKRAESSFGGAFDSNSAAVVFGELDVALVQTVGVQHNYAAQRQYEIGAFQNGPGALGGVIGAALGSTTNRVYYMTGRTSGMVNLSRILGPPVAIKALYEKYGDVCNVQNSVDKNSLNLRFRRGCGPVGGGAADNLTNYLCKFCLLISVQLSVQAGEITMFSDQMGMMFTGLDYQGD